MRGGLRGTGQPARAGQAPHPTPEPGARCPPEPNQAGAINTQKLPLVSPDVDRWVTGSSLDYHKMKATGVEGRGV